MFWRVISHKRPCLVNRTPVNVRCIVLSWYHAVLKILGKYSTTLSTPTRTTRKPRWLQLYFISLDQNFTEIYPDNSNSPLTRTVLRFPWEFEFLSFYCTYTVFLFVSHFSCLFLFKKRKVCWQKRQFNQRERQLDITTLNTIILSLYQRKYKRKIIIKKYNRK